MQAELAAVVNERHSSHSFTGESLALSQLSTLLKYSCGIVRSEDGAKVHRAQPSGGGRYPLEVYPVVLAGNMDVPEGVYHYNVRRHALEVLWQRKFSESGLLSFFTYEWVRKDRLSNYAISKSTMRVLKIAFEEGVRGAA